MVDCTLREMLVAGFRSIYSQEVAFDNPTFVVGPNGSGKSNFADAFAFLAEAMVSPLQAVGIQAVDIARPIRQPRHRLVQEDGVSQAVRLALLQPDCGAVLILFDGDDDCPRRPGTDRAGLGGSRGR